MEFNHHMLGSGSSNYKTTLLLDLCRFIEHSRTDFHVKVCTGRRRFQLIEYLQDPTSPGAHDETLSILLKAFEKLKQRPDQ